MSHAQHLEEIQHRESARYDRFDGFDRGDDDAEEWSATVANCKAYAEYFAKLTPEEQQAENEFHEIHF